MSHIFQSHPEQKPKKSNPFLDFILIIVVIIFSVLSAYTTKVGFSLVWGGEDDLMREGMAWGIAVGTSLFMIYLSLKVVYYYQEGRFLALITGYLLIASLSVFFNFNAIHSRQTKSVGLKNDAVELRTQLMQLRANGIAALESHYRIEALQTRVDSLQAEMVVEKDHNMRPGEGPIHQRIKQQHAVAKAKLEASNKAVGPLETQIAQIAQPAIDTLETALRTDRESDYITKLRFAETAYNEIGALVQAKVPGYGVPRLALEAKNIEKPSYTLASFLGFVNAAFSAESPLTGEEKARTWLSLALAFVLDFPIFFSLVVLNWQRSRPNRSRSLISSGRLRASTRQPDSNLWN